jgi:type IV secretory pathway VirB4 component
LTFTNRVRESLAYRAAARVLRAIGQLNEDGTRSPTLLVFDEVWKIKDKYPRILDVIKRGARTGGKENVITILATQAYEDLAGIPDIAKTAGVKIIGKQVGDYSQLVEDSGLAPQAAAAISVINNIAGSHAQFLLVLGSGEDKIVQMVQCDLSPVELWTFTTNPDERNARARVQTLKPDWPLVQVIAWLAEHYPMGLTGAGLVQIDETQLF